MTACADTHYAKVLGRRAGLNCQNFTKRIRVRMLQSLPWILRSQVFDPLESSAAKATACKLDMRSSVSLCRVPGHKLPDRFVLQIS